MSFDAVELQRHSLGFQDLDCFDYLYSCRACVHRLEPERECFPSRVISHLASTVTPLQA